MAVVYRVGYLLGGLVLLFRLALVAGAGGGSPQGAGVREMGGVGPFSPYTAHFLKMALKISGKILSDFGIAGVYGVGLLTFGA